MQLTPNLRLFMEAIWIRGMPNIMPPDHRVPLRLLDRIQALATDSLRVWGEFRELEILYRALGFQYHCMPLVIRDSDPELYDAFVIIEDGTGLNGADPQVIRDMSHAWNLCKPIGRGGYARLHRMLSHPGKDDELTLAQAKVAFAEDVVGELKKTIGKLDDKIFKLGVMQRGIEGIKGPFDDGAFPGPALPTYDVDMARELGTYRVSSMGAKNGNFEAIKGLFDDIGVPAYDLDTDRALARYKVLRAWIIRLLEAQEAMSSKTLNGYLAVEGLNGHEAVELIVTAGVAAEHFDADHAPLTLRRRGRPCWCCRPGQEFVHPPAREAPECFTASTFIREPHDGIEEDFDEEDYIEEASLDEDSPDEDEMTD